MNSNVSWLRKILKMKMKKVFHIFNWCLKCFVLACCVPGVTIIIDIKCDFNLAIIFVFHLLIKKNQIVMKNLVLLKEVDNFFTLKKNINAQPDEKIFMVFK